LIHQELISLKKSKLIEDADRLFYLANKHIENKYLPLEERKVFSARVKDYFKKGGNSVAGDMCQIAMRLPYILGVEPVEFNLREFLDE
jgi:hypothetical protein